MGAETIEYSADNAELEALLQSIDRPGEYYAYGRRFLPMPRLEVEPVGMLSFPVPAAQVVELIKTAERAPYGKGEETLVDTSVRNCWQVGVDRIQLGGDAWEDSFTQVLEQAAQGLGCPPELLEAELYKLLIYEPGGFFSVHRDTEKTDGMIATLVISLPTAGVGGQLVVRHQGNEVVIDMNARESSELVFAAFYADCKHETQPVSEGHRVSLIYNLVLREGDASAWTAPDYEEQVQEIAGLLRRWGNDGEAPDKIVWMLEHDYSEAGLSFTTLKNADAALARVLARAAERAGCELYAAIVHIEEYGPGIYSDDGEGYYWGNSGDLSEAVEMFEVDDYRHWLDGWVTPDGMHPDFGRMPLLEAELLPCGALDDVEPDEQRVHEASGNEGISVERAYRRAALALWPRQLALKNLAASGIECAVRYVADAFERAYESTDANGWSGELIYRLIDVWPERKAYLRDKEDAGRREMLRLLCRVRDERAAVRFLSGVVTKHYSGTENQELGACAEIVSAGGMQRFLPSFVETNLLAHAQRVLEFVCLLCEKLDSAEDREANLAWRDVLREATFVALDGLPHILKPPAQDNQWAAHKPKSLGADAIRDIFLLAWRFDLNEEADTSARTLVEHPNLVALDRAVPTALKELWGRDSALAEASAFAILWFHAADYLLARSAKPPEEPGNWTIAAEIGCDCEHCLDLTVFCKNPDETIKRFALREELRRHVQQVIRSHQLDIDCKTERKGRPYKLVCTKNRASYRRRLKEYAADVSHMRALVASAPAGNGAGVRTDKLERLRTAVAQSSGN